jgi:hypothetical protein
LIHRLIFRGLRGRLYIWRAWGFGSVDTEKKRAPWVPALIEPPDPLAPLEEWQSYRAGLDALEARLLVSHPDLDWLDGLRAFKAEADAVIARNGAERRKPGSVMD